MESKSSDENCNNPNSELHPSKLIMASHFLRALFRIQHTTTDSSFAGRSRKIRRAAYASMAYSVGTKRAWSSALLRKLRSRSRLRFPNPRRAKYAALPGRPRVARPQQREMDQAEALRELVPGGTSMDDCRLLEETADYIRCLSTQVRLMQAIMESVSF
ncbi:transcription factor IBH1-like [Musa acuminata AAA Group]|uniref:(wild Malaysian banana) hypothetical protein n=1 Tax=Musa acuminata subsp. malaccensis TaxID=214687 RepID=A0A804LBQ4_MUSAM|nr:PREDICTED: transcription factor IBH1-like [Musa acuminata subsp. malaccensis]CAG1865616.1 unnamed protein product [Musa acuminata subsp. malaccensis]